MHVRMPETQQCSDWSLSLLAHESCGVGAVWSYKHAAAPCLDHHWQRAWHHHSHHSTI